MTRDETLREALTDGPFVHYFGRGRPNEAPVPFWSFTVLEATDTDGNRHIFHVPTAALDALTPAAGPDLREALDWPTLANVIREVDGNHDLGAGELAERILMHPTVRAALTPAAGPDPMAGTPADELREAATDAFNRWRDYFDADERADFWKPLVIAMGRLGTLVNGRDMTEPADADGAEWAVAALATPAAAALDHGRCCECFDAPNMAAGHEHWDEQGA